MTPKEFVAKMRGIYDKDHHGHVRPVKMDEEGAHIAADKLIVELLRGIGYNEGADLFAAAEKWYS